MMSRGVFIACAVVTAWTGRPAWGQDAFVEGLDRCYSSGVGAVASLRLVQKLSDGAFLPLSPDAARRILDAAECECDSRDLYVEAAVVHPFSTTPETSVWEGNQCGNAQASRVATGDGRGALLAALLTGALLAGVFFTPSSRPWGVAPRRPRRRGRSSA